MKIFWIISMLLLALSSETHNFKAFPTKKAKSINQPDALYRSIVTGDKSALSSKLKKDFQQLGLMHLMTPSGLHLSSALMFFIFFPRLRAFILITLFCASFFFHDFFSLKRVLIFHVIALLIGKTKKTTNSVFILTFLIAILIGQFQSSPYSFTLSFLFWGVLIYERFKFKGLFYSQLLVAFVLQQKVNVLGYFLNPLVSSIFSLIFPFMLLNYPLRILDWFFFPILTLTIKMVSFTNSFSFLLLRPSLGIFFIPFLKGNFKFFWIYLIVLHVDDLNPASKFSTDRPRLFVSLPTHYEFIEKKKRKIYFIDTVCEERLVGLRCRKRRSSRLGGPEF